MSRILKTKGNVVTQEYGHNGHTGIDIVGTGRTTDYVVAHSNGKIVFCQKGQKNNPGSSGDLSYGNCVKIKHDNGYYTLYAHLQNLNVGLGQYVQRGQILGYMGNTGNSYGSHLHFEVFNEKNQRVNPKPYIDADLPNLPSVVDCTGIITYQTYSNGHWYDEVSKCDNTPDGYAGNGVDFISGIRCKPQFGEIFTQSHQLNGSWLGEVSSNTYKANDTQDGNSYSGIYNQPIDMIKFRTTKGYIDARVKTKRGWLPCVRFFKDYKDNVYVGNKGEAILGIQMK